MCVSTPQVIGLTKPSGGGGVYAATWFCDPDHLSGHVKGLRGKHGAKYRDRYIKRMVADALQVARISLLKFKPVETRLGSPFVPGFNEVPGNVDSNHLRP